MTSARSALKAVLEPEEVDAPLGIASYEGQPVGRDATRADGRICAERRN